MKPKNKPHKIEYIAMLAVSICVLLWSCAKQGFPSGGPKDIEPPVALAPTPLNGSTHFAGSQFSVPFNEYVVIKDADNNVLVSPPMDPKPEYSIKGHSLVVKLRDSLQPKTTYLFQFKEAIADFNEGNLLPSYEYVFSTGETIDSMCITGQVLDALTRAPREAAVSVLLLNDTTVPARPAADSLLQSPNYLLPPPVYATRCDKEGHFAFNYIKPGTYFVVAIEDEDKNLRLSASEAMAFNYEPVTTWVMPKPKPLSDTAAVSSHLAVADTHSTKPTAAIVLDTTKQSRLLLLMSQPSADKQHLTSSNFIKKGCARITSLSPMVAPRVVSFGDSVVWALNRTRDTLTLWTVHAATDSLRLIVSDPSGLHDTLKMRYHAPKKPVVPSSSTTTVASSNSKFPVSVNFNNSATYFDTLQLRFATPTRLKAQRPIIYMSSDSTQRDTVAVRLDTNHLVAYIDWRPTPGKKYTVRLLRSTFVDLYGNTNDSLLWHTEITKPEQYSNLTITLNDSLIASNAVRHYIVELLDEKGTPVQRQSISNTLKLIVFSHLKSGKYKLRVIVDANANGKWDPVNYALHRQPEEVFYLKKTLDVRENWDFVEQWVLPGKQ